MSKDNNKEGPPKLRLVALDAAIPAEDTAYDDEENMLDAEALAFGRKNQTSIADEIHARALEKLPPKMAQEFRDLERQLARLIEAGANIDIHPAKHRYEELRRDPKYYQAFESAKEEIRERFFRGMGDIAEKLAQKSGRSVPQDPDGGFHLV